ncbi:Gamma-glutamyltranspeptidase [Roseospira marina]|uniref:Gamma-glutamyltranspeptidase n=1 Tax=Roseospira marina TaxID=140057 RepID=A0A5M6IBE3_9PROT|nr:gamma-glutamyltransferase [Roseospira marina]KAA5605566.1 Gamma-glutamyltranspeptidase [Roseospira marina]MBB4313371.1 gamma-glutamyltranspeptidase/glutathione hydrolase [Roseospira marina]MBB5085888.1 gamma-glutamyltranspeptidase/glutathione hydrolase [Roseospira marina]
MTAESGRATGRRETIRGAVAAGHPETAAAAAEVLADGGNAFDAVVAGLAASVVVEPALSSLGGGGFLVAHPVNGRPLVLDFFAQTPARAAPYDQRPLDFRPVLADFGTTTQEFHVGRAAAAVPGMIPGMCAIQRDLGRLPLARLLEPGIRLARDGVPLAALQAHIHTVIAPILLHTAEARAVFGDPADPARTQPAGHRLRLPALADTLDLLGREGERIARDGPVAEAIAALCADGGLLTGADCQRYRVLRHAPLDRGFRGARVLTNPPPSSGGALIAFGLALVEDEPAGESGPPPDPATLARIMRATGLARDESGLTWGADDARVEALLAEPMLARGRAALAGRAHKAGGTTHLSVLDAEGNAAACTVSNGEGCGHMVPGCGFMLNNMLGEEDLNPAGFFRWAPDTRVSSMMAPTLAERPDGTVMALGSGGSNRIRTALLQVLCRVLAADEPLVDAIAAPRLHVERDHLDLEPGFAAADVRACAEAFPDHRVWPEPSMFYGGVHAVARQADGTFEAAGDPRRGGAARLAEPS